MEETQQSGWRQTCPEIDGQPSVWLLSLERDQVIDEIDFGNIEDDSPGPQYEEDHGDAPEPYFDHHLSVSSTVLLGSSVDGEWIMQRDPHALGDDNDGNDDEDGVEFMTPLLPGQQATVRIDLTHVTGPEWNVSGRIDYDQNGSFDTAESIMDAPVVLTPGVVNALTFTVPASAVPGATFARFSIIDCGVEPAWGLPYGEVEDYEVVIGEDGPYPPEAQDGYDFGDAPDSYHTLHNSGGPYHDLDEVMMGHSVDAEADGQPGPLANADNDDGVFFPLGLEVNQFATVVVNINSPLGVPAAIAGWIDYDQNGMFEDPAERILGGTYTGAGVPVAWTETFVVPSTALPGPTYARFRVYRTEPFVDVFPSPTGYGEEGEVEDYYVEIRPGPDTPPAQSLIAGIKFNDLDGDGLWESADGETGLPNWTIWLDIDNDGTPDQTTQTDSQGHFEFPGLSPGTYTVGEEPQPGWIQTTPQTPGTLSVTTANEPFPTAHFLFFGNHLEQGRDYGDAPSPYPEASHELGGPWLGNTPPDAEAGTQAIPPGFGDDHNGVDDEDGGVVLLSDLVVGQSTGVAFNLSGLDPYWSFAAWIDLNRDGDWDDPDEQIMAGGKGPSWWATMPASFLIPSWARPGTTYLRVRIVRIDDEDVMTGLTMSSSGPGGPGEVEDYQVEIKGEGLVVPPGEILGGMKFDDLDGNGQRDPGEPGLGNWRVWIDLDGDGVRDVGEDTLTNPDGSFYFVGLSPGTYTVHEQMQAGWRQTYPGGAGTQTIAVTAGQPLPSVLFGNQRTGERDYGDAPLPYPEASHLLGGPYSGLFGDAPDPEPGMQREVQALGDDNDADGDDENGLLKIDLVKKPGVWSFCELKGCFNASPDAKIAFWIDFNGDGDWDDPKELVGQPFGWCGFKTGPQDWFGVINSFASEWMPTDTKVGTTYARLRVYDDCNYIVSPSGAGGPGEVEDFLVEIKGDGAGVPPGGIIHGYKWNDINGNGQWDILNPVEPPLAGWTIWLDANGSGTQDAGDRTTQTDAQGHFRFTGVPAGTYTVAEQLQPGWSQTTPGGAGTYTETVATGPGSASFPLMFGNRQTGGSTYDGRIFGSKWHDRNGDGLADAGEPMLAGEFISI